MIVIIPFVISSIYVKSLVWFPKLNTSIGFPSKIDFVNIDVEGNDYQVLKQIKIEKLKPKLISIETHHPDGSESENFSLIQEFLKKNNFIIYKRVGPTTLYTYRD